MTPTTGLPKSLLRHPCPQNHKIKTKMPKKALTIIHFWSLNSTARPKSWARCQVSTISKWVSSWEVVLPVLSTWVRIYIHTKLSVSKWSIASPWGLIMPVRSSTVKSTTFSSSTPIKLSSLLTYIPLHLSATWSWNIVQEEISSSFSWRLKDFTHFLSGKEFFRSVLASNNWRTNHWFTETWRQKIFS